MHACNTPTRTPCTCNMDVQVQSSRILLTGDQSAPPFEVPLTVFDRFASNIHVAVLFAFSAPTPTNDTLIRGLSETLALFPTLTAQLGYSHHLRRPCLMLGGGCGSALLVEAVVPSELSEHLPLEPSPDFEFLHPSPENATHVFQVQLNRFACGGLVLATTAHHRVADGQSMSTFFTAWARTVRGAHLDCLPVYDQSWLTPRCPPRCEFEHWGLDFVPRTGFTVHRIDVDASEITNILLRYPSEFLGRLKADTKHKYTTFETLLAHMWRKVTIARGLHDTECTMVRVSVNGRRRLKPPVPNEFFGNLVLNAYPKADVRQLLSGGLGGAAAIVHEAIARVDEQYFQSFIDFGELYGDEELVPAYDMDGIVISPVLDADSWLGFEFEELDFGSGGTPRAFLPTWLPYEGLMMFVPGMGDGGGVDVFVTLLNEHAKLMREISHSLE